MLPTIPGKVETTGIVLPADLPFETWVGLGAKLAQSRESLRWWTGDWLAYGEAAYGEKYAQALDHSQWDYQTLRNLVWVARAIPHADRRAGLTWSHHAECAALEPEQREALLTGAAEHGWSVAEIRQKVREATPPPKKGKIRGLHVGAYLLFEQDGDLFLSNKDGEVDAVDEASLEHHLDAYWKHSHT